MKSMLDVILSIDAAFLKAILALPHPQWLNGLFLALSFAGTGGRLWIALGAALTAARRMRVRDFVILVAAVALVHLVVDIVLKPAIGRPRPFMAAPDLPVYGTYPETLSFPSGHAANATAAALVITRRWPHYRGILWAVAVLVAVARVYLGMHYPADAMAGAVIGLMCGYLALYASSVTSAVRAPRSTTGSDGD
jgi:undecaprenyl-diphosphatase